MTHNLNAQLTYDVGGIPMFEIPRGDTKPSDILSSWRTSYSGAASLRVSLLSANTRFHELIFEENECITSMNDFFARAWRNTAIHGTHLCVYKLHH